MHHRMASYQIHLSLPDQINLTLTSVQRYTVQPVFKDQPLEEINLVFVHRWSLISGSFMQKMRNLEIKSVVAIDMELLYKGGV